MEPSVLRAAPEARRGPKFLRRFLSALVVCGLALLVLTWSISVYQLVAGHVIQARVLSCGAKSCDVAWVDGSEHGVNSTDRTARPGELMEVYHVPGHESVTSRESLLLTVCVVPVLFLVIAGVVLMDRRRRKTLRRGPAVS